MPRPATTNGYSLFELLIVIVIIGILAGITMRSLRGANEAVRVEATRDEMDQLAFAIAGNPSLSSGGIRTDYGYVGDVGAIPPNLDALVTNPGGYATWKGPYLADDFSASAGGSSSEFKHDAWGNPYSYTGGSSITAAADGKPMTRQIANDVNELLYNRISLTITDLDHSPPGAVYRDSVATILYVPDGIGSIAPEVRFAAADGSVQYDSIPIGLHRLLLTYTPTGDTLTRRIAVNPGSHIHLDMQFPEDVW